MTFLCPGFCIRVIPVWRTSQHRDLPTGEVESRVPDGTIQILTHETWIDERKK